MAPNKVWSFLGKFKVVAVNDVSFLSDLKLHISLDILDMDALGFSKYKLEESIISNIFLDNSDIEILKDVIVVSDFVMDNSLIDTLKYCEINALKLLGDAIISIEDSKIKNLYISVDVDEEGNVILPISFFKNSSVDYVSILNEGLVEDDNIRYKVKREIERMLGYK